MPMPPRLLSHCPLQAVPPRDPVTPPAGAAEPEQRVFRICPFPPRTVIRPRTACWRARGAALRWLDGFSQDPRGTRHAQSPDPVSPCSPGHMRPAVGGFTGPRAVAALRLRGVRLRVREPQPGGVRPAGQRLRRTGKGAVTVLAV